MSRACSPLRKSLFSHIMAGGTPKEFGYVHRQMRASTQKLLWAMGLRKYYLTPEEHAEVMARRRAKGEWRVAA
mgnify:CR=1 FL=1